jgi:hypothetical protein
MPQNVALCAIKICDWFDLKIGSDYGPAMLRPGLVLLILFSGCGTDLATIGEDDSSPSSESAALAAPNVIPVRVDGSSPWKNIPEISVTICVPGTTNCQTIPHIMVDTASTGLRVYAQAIHIPLPRERDSQGNPIAECVWAFGYIKRADIALGGLKALNLPLQVLQSADPAMPSDCMPDEPAYDPNSYNGMLGLSPSIHDVQTWNFYSCGSGGCTSASVSPEQMPQNPVSAFPTDNNGYAVKFPSVPAQGAESVSGSIIFGLDTRPNNQTPFVLNPIVPQETWGQFRVESNGKTYTSAFDTGTWQYNFPALGADVCTDAASLLCPASALQVHVKILDATGATVHTPTLHVGNYDGLPAGNNAFNDIATTVSGSNDLMLGMPFFYGRTIYFAIEKQYTAQAPWTGPWVAY